MKIDNTTLSPLDFWARKRDKMRALAAVAEKVLVIPPSAASSERLNSAAGATWTARRASLRVGRVGLMVYVYYNWRVLQRKANEASAMSWDDWFEWLESLPPLERDDNGRIKIHTASTARTPTEQPEDPIDIDMDEGSS